MAKELTSNVIVDGVWYGPDYPQNKPTGDVLDQITNPAAFDENTSAVDLRMRVDDGLAPVEDQPDGDEGDSGTTRRRSRG